MGTPEFNECQEPMGNTYHSRLILPNRLRDALRIVADAVNLRPPAASHSPMMAGPFPAPAADAPG